MDKIHAWLESFKSFFTSEIGKISTAQTELVDARADLAKATTTVAERDGTIADLTAKLEAANKANASLTTQLQTAQELCNKQGTEIKGLQENLAKAEKTAKDAEALVAGQGLSREQLPAGESKPGSAKTCYQIYTELVQKGKAAEAGRYFSENEEQIISRK